LKSAYQALLDADAGLEATNEWLDTEDEILKKMPLLSRDQIKGWKAVFSKDGGWLAAAKAINAIGEYLRDQGVKFGFYGAGSFRQPLLAEGVCIGVETVDGTRYYADKIVLAAGAWSSALVDLHEQCVSKVPIPSDIHHIATDIDLGLGICTYTAHTRRSRSLQKRSRSLQWRCRLLF
jgi:sarcosine oxidase/L-pipecolate oxidase